MDELMKAILGEAGGTGGGSRGQSSPIADLIGGILGGGAAPSGRRAPAQGQDPLADLIGGILGGGGGGSARGGNAQGTGQILDLIGAIMGGGAAPSGARGGQEVNPISAMLAEKLGIPPQVAQVVVAFFMSKLLSGMTGQQGGQPESYKSGGRDKDDIDLDDLLEVMDNDKALNARLSHSGMPQELAAKTGMDPKLASQSLEQLVKIIGTQRQTPQPAAPPRTDLKHLLDTWK